MRGDYLIEVHHFQDVIVLGDKDVESIEGSIVKFKDGSVADLDQMTCINKGKGEIKFEYSIEEIEDASTKAYEFEKFEEIILTGGNLFFEIQPSDKALLEVIGTDTFHGTTKIYETNQGIRIDTIRNSNSVIMGDMYVNGKRIKGDPIEGKLIIKVPNSISVYIQNHGMGKGIINVPINEIKTDIHGSLDVTCGTVANSNIEIHGSGDVHINEITESFVGKIHGSGDIKIDSGELNEFKMAIHGSGTVKADIKVKKAELIMHGSGDIFIKQVTEESFEVHGGSGSVKVGLRG